MATSMFRKLVDPFGISGGDSLFGYKGYASGKKGGGFEYQPYSGIRPPRPEYLRPAEKLTWETISRRSQGQDVGYDPKRTELLTGLVKNENQRKLDEDLRAASGSLSSAGLSGNPRAYEALAGRARKNSAMSLNDSLAQISISDLERQNQERDINTARLADFNRGNFAQENNAANFDLDVYNAEQGNRMGAANFDEGGRRYDTSRRDELFSDLGGIAATGASIAMGNPAPLMIYNSSQPQQTGTGIMPNNLANSTYYNPANAYGNRTAAYRNLVR